MNKINNLLLRQSLLLSLMFLALSCQSQEDKKENKQEEQTISGKTELSQEEQEKKQEMEIEKERAALTYSRKEEYLDIFRKNNFRFPDEKTFRERLVYVFNLDLADYPKEKLIHAVSKGIQATETERFPWIFTEDHFFYWGRTEEETEDEDMMLLNNYIFYNDLQAFNILKKKNSEYLALLLIYFGYDKDPELLAYMLKEGELPPYYISMVSLGAQGMKGKYELRRNILDYIFQVRNDINIIESKLLDNILDQNEIIAWRTQYEGNRNADAVYVLDKMLAYSSQNPANIPAVNYYLKKYPDLYLGIRYRNLSNSSVLNQYVKNNLPVYDKIKDTAFIQDIYSAEVQKSMITVDLKAGKSANSPVIRTLQPGEKVTAVFFLGEENQILVFTPDKQVGYISKANLKIVKE